MTKLEQEFIDFVADILEVPADGISLNTAYGSIPQWDSVMQLRLTLEIGGKYGVEIPMKEVFEIKTLADFFKYLNKR